MAPITSIQRRPDIQALRGIAVGLVVLSHLPSRIKFSGGFVGVDVFFVISGFVIMRMMMLQSVPGSSSVEFYFNFVRRRCNRLIPPMLAMTCFVLASSLLFAPPTMLKQIVDSVISSNFFSSNFYFIKNFDSYWNPNILKNPLLHTWSLAVEFQVYLFIPLLTRKWISSRSEQISHQKQLGIFWGVSIFSFATFVFFLLSRSYSILGQSPINLAFYLPISRLWEFSLGIAAAIVALSYPNNLMKFRHSLSLSSCLLIPLGIYVSNRIGELNLSVIAVATGTAIVLAVGEIGHIRLVSRLVVNPLFEYVGDRSYSIYLWHWPLLALARWIKPASLQVSLMSLVVGLLLAEISYRMIETPRFYGASRHKSRYLIPVALVVVGSLVGLWTSQSNWYQKSNFISNIAQPFPESEKSSEEIVGSLGVQCGFGEFQIRCINNSKDVDEVVVLGDSLAFRSFPAVQYAARELGLNATVFWIGHCGIELDSCRNSKIGDTVYEYLSEHKVRGIIVASNFDRESNRLNAVERDAGVTPLCESFVQLEDCPLHQENVEAFKVSARDGLNQLHNYSNRLLISLPFPQQAQIPPNCISKALFYRLFSSIESSNECGRTSIEWQEKRQGLYPTAILQTSRDSEYVTTWNPLDYLCFSGWCPSVINKGEQLMSDGIHWTPEGSRFLYPVFKTFLSTLKEP